MNSNESSQNYERIPAPDIAGVPSYAQLSSLEALRYEQDVAINQAYLKLSSGDSISAEDQEAIADGVIESYLLSTKIEPSDDKYGKIKSLASKSSVTAISHRSWSNETALDGSYEPSGSQKIAQLLQEQYIWEKTVDDDYITSDAQALAELTVAREAAAKALDGSREAFARKSQKVQRSAVRRRGQGYKDAKDKYFANVQEMGRMTFKERIETQDELSDDEKLMLKADITLFQFEEMKKLRDDTTEKLKGTKSRRIVDFLNRGSLKMRIAKGVGIGIIAGATGTFLAGAAGAAFLSTAVVGASRFVRGYALHSDTENIGADVYDDDTYRQYTNTINTYAYDDIAKHLQAATQVGHDMHEDDTKSERTKRQKSLTWGVGSVAVGAVAGYGLHAGAEYLSGKDLQLLHPVEFVKDHFGSGNHSAHVASEHGSGVSGSNNTPPHGGNHDVLQGNLADSPSGGTYTQLSQEALTIRPGEGFYSEFQQMGVPKSQWAGLLHDIGPKLHEQGLAYFQHTSNGQDSLHGMKGEWRIGGSSYKGGFPEKLTPEQFKVFADAARQSNYRLGA